MQQIKKRQNGELFPYNIFLIGFMGSGKSIVSQWMKKRYGMERIEMDQLIEKRQKMSISEIFRIYGEEYFRSLETDLLVEMQTKRNVVVSCGGGVPMRECNVQEMKKNGKVVLLTAAPQTILERVRNSHDRPLLENHKDVGYISELMEKRRIKYEAAADVRIETDQKDMQEICEEIIEKLQKLEKGECPDAEESAACR